MQIYLQFSEREYLRDKVSEVVQIERNAKGKLVFLCICFTSLREQRPLVPRCSLPSCVPSVASGKAERETKSQRYE